MLGKYTGGFNAFNTLVLVEDPGINLGADYGIDHVDSDRDMVDVVFRDGIHVFRKGKAVGRQAQFNVGSLLYDEFQGFEGLGGVRERVAGTRDPKNGHLRDRRCDSDNLFGRLLWRQPFTDDAWAGFVGAIVFAVTVIALNVTSRRDRHMHACEMMVSLFAVTGMVLDLFPYLRRKIVLTSARSATRLAASAVSVTPLMLCDLL